MRKPSSPLLLALLLLFAGGCAASAGDTRLDPKAPKGAVGGRIKYSQGVAPAMRICAITGESQRCIDIPAGRTLYRIAELPDGEYQVVARLQSTDTPVAGHVQEVQCIRAPCPPRLATLSVLDGKDITSADINGFYAERSDFPAVE